MNQEALKLRVAKMVAQKSAAATVNPKDQATMDLFQDSAAYKYQDKNIDLEAIKTEIYKDISAVEAKDNLVFFGKSDKYLWGLKPAPARSEKILKSAFQKRKMYIMEDTFIRSVSTLLHKLSGIDDSYFCSCGYTVDDLSHYVDATRPSRMEKVLNSDLKITDEQKQRAKKVINKIINNKITKYNNQPVYEPKIGRKDVKKVLVIDQSYNDYSIIKGMANDKTFDDMLKAAISENPNADIIIKTHPDSIGEATSRQKCYYQNTQEKENVYKITEMINPISLIEYVDKVYVCSSQFGFEALMCGKEVHLFGMPFYAGWGLTTDAQKLERRTKQRTLEEVFYIAYIMFSMYVNPQTNKPCEIEDAIDFLISAREQYFKELNEKKENKND